MASRQLKHEDSDDDADLKAAIAASLKDHMKAGPSSTGSMTRAASSGSGLAGLDRQQMEKERRERAAQKRKADELDDKPDVKPNASDSSSKYAKASGSGSSLPRSMHTPPQATKRFWKWEIKRIASHIDISDNADSMSFSDVIGEHSSLKFMICSALCFNFDWLLQQLPAACNKVIVQHGEDGEWGPRTSVEVPNVILVNPSRLAAAFHGCMHTKIIVLFRADYVRVVVSTANLIAGDWGQTENVFWIQDFPAHPEGGGTRRAAKFQVALNRLLDDMEIPPHCFQSLLPRYNFSGADADVRLVWTKPATGAKLPAPVEAGEQSDPALGLGHFSLMRAVQDLRCMPLPDEHLEVESQCSSLGKYAPDWMWEMYDSFTGVEPSSKAAHIPAKWSKTTKGRAKSAASGSTSASKDKGKASTVAKDDDAWPPVTMYWPTLEHVKMSFLSDRAAGAGQIFLDPKYWNAKDYPKHMFRKAYSRRAGILMHSKIIVATIKHNGNNLAQSRRAVDRAEWDDDDGDSDASAGTAKEKAGGWLYVGSANFTPTAWGRLSAKSKNHRSKEMTMKSYEAGVVIRLPSSGLTQFLDNILPYRRSNEPYDKGDEPFMQAVHLRQIAA